MFIICCLQPCEHKSIDIMMECFVAPLKRYSTIPKATFIVLMYSHINREQKSNYDQRSFEVNRLCLGFSLQWSKEIKAGPTEDRLCVAVLTSVPCSEQFFFFFVIYDRFRPIYILQCCSNCFFVHSLLVRPPEKMNKVFKHS